MRRAHARRIAAAAAAATAAAAAAAASGDGAARRDGLPRPDISQLIAFEPAGSERPPPVRARAPRRVFLQVGTCVRRRQAMASLLARLPPAKEFDGCASLGRVGASVTFAVGRSPIIHADIIIKLVGRAGAVGAMPLVARPTARRRSSLVRRRDAQLEVLRIPDGVFGDDDDDAAGERAGCARCVGRRRRPTAMTVSIDRSGQRASVGCRPRLSARRRATRATRA